MKKINKIKNTITNLLLVTILATSCIFVSPIKAEAISASQKSKAIQTATDCLGVKYKLANDATNPKKGYLDCSGLMLYAYSKAGVTLPRTADMQYRCNKGKLYKVALTKNYSKVSNNLRAGDLLFFQTDKDSAIDHVGIYVGCDRMIHASSLKGKVVYESLNSYLKKDVVRGIQGYRRL